MENNTFIIDLDKHINIKATALAGRPNGEKLLEDLKSKGIILKEKEKLFAKIVIQIPKRIIIMNKSFFLGLFETRIQDLGKNAFIDKYEFRTSEFIKKKILENYIKAALLTNSSKEILGLDD